MSNKQSDTPQDIDEVQNRIVREFSALGDWTEKYKHIIKQGELLEPLEDEYKTEENMVKGCQSNVWLVADLEGDKVKFKADSDAAIVKGLIGLLMRVYNQRHPESILSKPPEFIEKIGMQEHLSATRANGLAAMIKQMKIYAMAFKTKLEQQAEA